MHYVTTRWLASALVAGVLLSGAACSHSPEWQSAVSKPPATSLPTSMPTIDRGPRLGLPASVSGRPYLSGAWLGGHFYPDALHNFGVYRGTPVDTVTAYSDTRSWESIVNDWTISTYRGFPGVIVYGLAMLPIGSGSTLADVANGKHDDVWRQVAANLQNNGRDRSVVRIGLEANGTWFPWGATTDTAPDFKRAFRRIALILRNEVPRLIIEFDISCGVPLTGSEDPMAPLTQLYPGDDVVDVVGCDVYDNRGSQHDGDNLGRTNRGPGLNDVRVFARSHDKPMAVPEWGLDKVYGWGDNPAFIKAFNTFLERYATEVLFENYFNEHGTSLRSSIWGEIQNPEAAATYIGLW